MRHVLFGLAYIVVYLATGALLASAPDARSVASNLLLAALTTAVCGAIVWRRREWQGSHRLFWDAFAVALALWTVGEVGFTIDQLLFGHPSWVRWHTMFSLCGGIGPMIAILARPHLGVRKASTPATGIDLISCAMLAGFIYAYFVLVPSVVPEQGANLEGTLLALVQAQRLVLVLGIVTAFWVSRGTSWQSTYGRLAIGVTAGFFFRIETSAAILDGRYVAGSMYDLAWIVPFLCYWWAALEAPASPPAGESVEEPTRSSFAAAASAVPVLLIPAIGYGLLHVQPIGQSGDSFRILLTTLTTVAGLGLLTLRLSVQGTELQRADQRLRLLAAATQQTGDLILITRADGAFEQANDACVRALGYSRGELARLGLRELVEYGTGEVLRALADEIRDNGIWRATLQLRRADGTAFPASSTVVALTNVDGRIVHYVFVLRDISEELRLRDQLVHSERLSAIGELVAGVAHEINNPLQTIVGCVELMLEERKGSPDDVRDLQLVRQEAARAGQIVRNLLAFVRRGAPDRVATDLNQIVKTTADLRDYHLGQKGISLHLDLQPGPLPVMANREEIQQVVVNLVINAEHALASAPGIGTIVLKTRSEGASQVLEVSDNGPGVPPHLRGKIFEPFFTTKEVGEGTGLGLSISLGIAGSHGGALELKPSAKGARFGLRLPAHVAPVIRAAESTAASPDGGDAPAPPRALVIENETAIRDLLARLLERRGFTVVRGSTAAEGRSLVEQPFDVVLCDVKLEDGSGVECYRRLRESGDVARTRFIFITGDASVVDEHPDVAEVTILAKPFTASDLDRVLNSVAIGV